MHWELWDTGSNNLVETFDSEAEALQGVREILAVNRPDFIDDLVLGVAYAGNEPQPVELSPVLRGATLQARLAEAVQGAVLARSRAAQEQIKTWLAEENWHVEQVPTSPESFNVVAM